MFATGGGISTVCNESRTRNQACALFRVHGFKVVRRVGIRYTSRVGTQPHVCMNESFRNPIFVVGPPRSGTTLLCALLNQHSEIAIMHECGVLAFSPTLRQNGVHRDWPERLDCFSGALNRHDLVLSEQEKRVIKGRRDAALSLYAKYGHSQHASMAGEKSPSYVRLLRQLFDDFPEGRIIILWRDFVEVGESMQRQAGQSYYFRNPSAKLRCALADCDHMQATLARKPMQASRIFHLTYDQLVTDTESLMQQLCTFLGLPYETRLCSLEGSDQRFIGDSSRVPLGNEVRRLNHSGSGNLTSKDLSRIRRFERRWANRYPNGYHAKLGRDIATRGGDAARVWWDLLAADISTNLEAAKKVAFATMPIAAWKWYRRRRQPPGVTQ